MKATLTRLTAAHRRREQALRKLLPRILEYAGAVAAQFELQIYKIKGQGHDPRAAITLTNAFEKLLPYQDVSVNRNGRKVHFTAAAILNSYRDQMLAAGVDIQQAPARLVSVKYCRAALMYFRLTKQPYPRDQFGELACRVARLQKQQQRAWDKAYAEERRRDIELKQQAAVQAIAAETAALQALSATVLADDPEFKTDLLAAMNARSEDIAHHHRQFFDQRRSVKHTGGDPRTLVALWRQHRNIASHHAHQPPT